MKTVKATQLYPRRMMHSLFSSVAKLTSEVEPVETVVLPNDLEKTEKDMTSSSLIVPFVSVNLTYIFEHDKRTLILTG